MASFEPPKLTFERWRTLPIVKRRHEIVDGVLITQLQSTLEHQIVLQEIAMAMAKFLESKSNMGIVFYVPFDFLIQREPLNVRQPDIMYLNFQHAGYKGEDDIPDLEFLETPPDVAVEILLQDEIDWVVADRLKDYQRAGVYECWLAHLDTDTIEILDLTGDKPETIATFCTEDTLRSDRIPGFELAVGTAFQ